MNKLIITLLLCALTGGMASAQASDTQQSVATMKSELLRITDDKSWGNAEMLARKPAWNSELKMAEKAYKYAAYFDAVYNDLTRAERKKIAASLKRLALDPLLGDWLNEPTRIHSLNSMGHNWWTSCVCMGGILAMSLSKEYPECRNLADDVAEALPEWFNFEGDVLQGKPKTMDDRGGMYESLNYAVFGVSEALEFLKEYLKFNPQRGKKLLDAIRPHLERLPAYFAHVSYPRSNGDWNIDFGDSRNTIKSDRCLNLLAELGFKQENKKTLEKSILLEDFGWCMMRTSWEKDATLVAMKSGYTWNHSHADANSFVIFHKGVDILKDAGNCWYPNPEYRNYFFQSQAHNVVLVDGEGQPREQQYRGSMLPGSMHNLIDNTSANTTNATYPADNLKGKSTLRYVLANGTGPMAHKLSRNFRHLLWIDNVIYVVDDLKSHEPAEYQWLWHPGGKAVKRGYDVNITKDQSSIVLRPLYPRPLAHSNFVHDYPDDLWWEYIDAPYEYLDSTEQYMSFHLPGKVDKVKGLTAIILKDSPTDNNLPQTEMRDGKNWIGVRTKNITKNGTTITDLYINQLADGRLMHSNSWIEADGWTTDAYMFAITYEEGTNPADAKDIFICYGSALRRAEKTYFSSLTKKTTIVR